MKKYFRFMASSTGRWIRGLIGFMLSGWGYSTYDYPRNLILLIIGVAVMMFALFNLLPLASVFGLSWKGGDIISDYGDKPLIPGEEEEPKP